MSSTGKYASCIYTENATLKYEYIFVSDDADITISDIVFNGVVDSDALIPAKEDVIFLSSYQKTG